VVAAKVFSRRVTLEHRTPGDTALKFDPQSLFLGLIDFFSVLLPGALVVSLLQGALAPRLFGPVFPPIHDETQGWIAFLFCSYLVGHFVFLVGAMLDVVDKPVREWFWPEEKDHTLQEAIRIKQQHIGDDEKREVINAFQWAKVRLAIACPSGLLEVQRLEADSKFFRSLVVVLLGAAVYLFVTVQVGLGVASLALLGLSFWRYVERRYKSTQQAFRS